MKNVFKILALISVFALLTACGAFVKPIEGNTGLGFLAGEKQVNVVFDYNHLSVNEYAKEEQYIDAMVSKKEEDEAGTGEEWKVKWFGQRDAVFEPEFIEAINQYNDKGLTFSKNQKDAKYTMYVDVTYVKTGWNVGVMRQNAEIDLKVKFVETVSLNDGMQTGDALFKVIDVPGHGDMGYDFSVSQRLGASFELAGRSMGKYISKQDF